MFIKNVFFNKKFSNGFTLVEIVVVLVILAILAAATIPSMLGFVNDAKQKSLINEVRAVYTAAQAYATEHFAKGDSDETITRALNGIIDSTHTLHYLLQNDATGKVFATKIQNGKVKSFSYVKNDFKYDYESGSGIKTSQYVSSAIFDVGTTVNIKMKKLAGNPNTDLNVYCSNIRSFLRSAELIPEIDEDDNQHIISASDSEYQIYAWCDGSNICYYSEADDIFLNADSAYLFSCCNALSDISGLQNLDTSKVTDLNHLFWHCNALSDISALKNWDTSNVKSLYSTFDCCSILSDISALEHWNTHKVSNLCWAFCSSSLSDISALSKWDTSSVTDLRGIFANCSSISDATILDSWNIINANKSNAFKGTQALTDGNLPSWY